MTEIKNRIAAIDAFGRSIATATNELIDAEDLKGHSAATIRRVEELIKVAQGKTPSLEHEALGLYVLPSDFEFAIMKGGITVAPFVTLSGYTGRVGP